MNFFKKLAQLKTVPQIISNKVEKIKGKFANPNDLITQITPNLYYLQFPQSHLIDSLSQLLKNKFKSNFFIWNIGEDIYQTDRFLNQVSHTIIKNYPVFPLASLLLIAVNIKNWLKQSGNVAFVHCGKNKSRSALLFSIYLYLDGQYEYFEDAIVQVNKILELKKSQTVFPSQHIFMRDCMNLFNGFPINTKPLKLGRLIINKIPEMAKSSNPNNVFSPHISIFKLNEHIFTTDKYQIQNETLVMNLDVHVVDDILISIQHANSPNDLYPCIRIIVNTNFITDDYIRINLNQLDFTRNIQPSTDFWIDFIFEPIEGNKKSILSQVWDEVQNVFAFNIQEKKQLQPVRKIQQQQLQQRLNQITGLGLSKQEHDASFAIDDSSPQTSNINKPEQKQVQKLVMQDELVQQADDIDDYMKQLQQSVDMS